MIRFESIKWKNLLSTGNEFTEIQLNKSQTTLIVGENGAGKCLAPTTEVNIDFCDEKTRKKFINFLSKK